MGLHRVDANASASRRRLAAASSAAACASIELARTRSASGATSTPRSGASGCARAISRRNQTPPKYPDRCMTQSEPGHGSVVMSAVSASPKMRSGIRPNRRALGGARLTVDQTLEQCGVLAPSRRSGTRGGREAAAASRPAFTRRSRKRSEVVAHDGALRRLRKVLELARRTRRGRADPRGGGSRSRRRGSRVRRRRGCG